MWEKVPKNPSSTGRQANGARASSARKLSAAKLVADVPISNLRQERTGNIRQLLLRSHRALNKRIADRLNSRGFADIRPMHLALFSNLDFEGTRISDLSDRAGMTIQGMGQIISEMEEHGYVTRTTDKNDGRVRIVKFTKLGWKMMLDSIEGLRKIEADYEKLLHPGAMEQLKTALQAIADSEK